MGGNVAPERRLDRLESALPPCPVCKGQAWRVVIDPEPMPESPCPACGRAIRVVHIIRDDEEASA